MTLTRPARLTHSYFQYVSVIIIAKLNSFHDKTHLRSPTRCFVTSVIKTQTRSKVAFCYINKGFHQQVKTYCEQLIVEKSLLMEKLTHGFGLREEEKNGRYTRLVVEALERSYKQIRRDRMSDGKHVFLLLL